MLRFLSEFLEEGSLELRKRRSWGLFSSASHTPAPPYYVPKTLGPFPFYLQCSSMTVKGDINVLHMVALEHINGTAAVKTNGHPVATQGRKADARICHGRLENDESRERRPSKLPGRYLEVDNTLENGEGRDSGGAARDGKKGHGKKGERKRLGGAVVATCTEDMVRADKFDEIQDTKSDNTVCMNDKFEGNNNSSNGTSRSNAMERYSHDPSQLKAKPGDVASYDSSRLNGNGGAGVPPHVVEKPGRAVLKRNNDCPTSTFRGVRWSKQQGRWRVDVHYKGKDLFLAYFNDEVEAARVFDDAASTLYEKGKEKDRGDKARGGGSAGTMALPRYLPGGSKDVYLMPQEAGHS